jgi:YteA family regulatory protein
MDMALSRPETEHFKQKLFDLRADTLDMIQHLSAGLDESLGDSVSADSLYDNHPADQANTMFERSKDYALREGSRTTLANIDRALERLRDGKYGICMRCGQEIPKERLEVQPQTSLCVRCEKMEEDYVRERPIEEEALGPNLLHSFTDGSSNVVFDGEDAWQDVAMVGTSNAVSEVPGATGPGDAYWDSHEDIGTVFDVEKIGMTYDEAKKEFVRPERAKRVKPNDK